MSWLPDLIVEERHGSYNEVTGEMPGNELVVLNLWSEVSDPYHFTIHGR